MPKKFYTRKSIRLPGFDYGQDGFYLFTLVTKNRVPFLGKIKSGNSILSKEGEVVLQEWSRTGALRDNVTLDEFIIMLEHVHGIIKIGNPSLPAKADTLIGYQAEVRFAEFKSPSNNLGSIIGGFKRSCTREIRPFNPHFGWTRNYWERVMRSEEELHAMRSYIRMNPKNWKPKV